MTSVGISGSAHRQFSYPSRRASPTVISHNPQTASFSRSDTRDSQHRCPSSCPSLDQSPVKSLNEDSLYRLQGLSESTSLHNYHPSLNHHPLLDPHPSLNPQSSSDIFDKIHRFISGSPDKELELKVPKADFDQVCDMLESTNDSVRYSYSWIDEKLVVYPMPSAAHEALLSPITLIHERLVNDIKSHVPQAQLNHLGSALTHLENANGHRTRGKGADASVEIKLDPEDERVFPLIVFEIGLSQTEAELDLDARHWLYETQGQTVSRFRPFCIQVYKNILGTGWRH
jgi:hypothetical protein